MTSPPRELEEPFEDEGDLLGEGPLSIGPDEEEEDGEELFGDNMEAYANFYLTIIKSYINFTLVN